MRIILSSNPYRDRGLRAALEAKKILERAGVETALCLPFVPKKGVPPNFKTFILPSEF